MSKKQAIQIKKKEIIHQKNVKVTLDLISFTNILLFLFKKLKKTTNEIQMDSFIFDKIG